MKYDKHRTLNYSKLKRIIRKINNILVLNRAKLFNVSATEIATDFKPETKKLSSVKMRWKDLARNAFNYSNLEKSKLSPVNSFDDDHILDLIALNSPKREKILSCDHEWVQLSGHDDSFALAGPGTIWKKRTSDSTEVRVYQMLMQEPIAEMVPKFYRDVEYQGDNFIELEDLLYQYKDASIMDIKMGTRTFLESEVNNAKPRSDLYDKMYKIDPDALTEEEHLLKGVTKLRYMRFREALSSSSNLGFRIEGFKVGKDVMHNKNLHLIKKKEDVSQTLRAFFRARPEACQTILNRLKTLMKLFESSDFFKRHEIIGSSLLIIYTGDKAGVWMIDFAKTVRVPQHIQINHRQAWQLGNHEDGYLLGLDNLISLLEGINTS